MGFDLSIHHPLLDPSISETFSKSQVFSPASFGKYEIYFSVFAGLLHLAYGTALLTWRVGRCFYYYVTHNKSHMISLAHSYEVHPGDHLARGAILLLVFIGGSLGFHLLNKYDAWWEAKLAKERETETKEEKSIQEGDGLLIEGGSDKVARAIECYASVGRLSILGQPEMARRTSILEGAKESLQEGNYNQALEWSSYVAFYGEGVIEPMNYFHKEYYPNELQLRDAQIIAAESCVRLAESISDPENFEQKIDYYKQAITRYEKASSKVLRDPQLRVELFLNMIDCYRKVGQAYSAANQSDLALLFFEKALELSERVPNRKYPELTASCTAEFAIELREAGYLEEAAHYFVVLGRFSEESQWFSQAAECFEELVVEFDESLSQEEINRYKRKADKYREEEKLTGRPCPSSLDLLRN